MLSNHQIIKDNGNLEKTEKKAGHTGGTITTVRESLLTTEANHYITSLTGEFNKIRGH